MKQYKVVYNFNGQIREKMFFTDTSFAAGVAFLRSCPGVLPSAIRDILDTTPATAKQRTGSPNGGARKQFTMSPDKFDRLVAIWRADKKFSMPISASPDQEDGVTDEIADAGDGLTIASPQKLFPSHDIVFSANPEVDTLLEGSGGHAGPFFNNKTLRVFHGPRKALYNRLLDAGFKPTHMGVLV